MSDSKKKHGPSKPGIKKPKPPRDPFASRPQSGAGYHSESKYGKRDRRKVKEEIDDDLEEEQ
ncbi:MAG: hypothetical protein WC828_04280 [Thermoleophilia bacterium]|jgi:hypothetical protein